MQMKKLIINGQTFIIVDAEAMRKLADSDLNMKGKLIYDAIIHANKLSFPGLNQDEPVEVVSGSVEQGVPMLVFSGHDEGSMPVLRNIHDGIEDSDAATVGQVKAVEKAAVKKNTDASVSSLKILHSPETMDAVCITGSAVSVDGFTVNALTFSGDWNGESIDTDAVILRGIHDGIEDNDAATVGQVRSVDLTEQKELTEEQKAQARQNIGALSESAQQDIDYLLQDMDQGVWPAVNSAVTVNKQTLTDEQKAQARENIGAASRGYVDQAIADAIANLPVYNGEVEEV